MARTVKEHEYAVRRNAILDVTQHLVETKGYEQMAIQDILDNLQISKGAFYHYFASKQELLEALIERMLKEAEQLLLPSVYDPTLPALEKLLRFFATLNRWKIVQKPFVLALLHMWYTDNNAIVRQKLHTGGMKQLTPLLTAIIHQGLQEGVLTTAYPDHAGEVILSLLQNLGEILSGLLLSGGLDRDLLRRIERTVAAYTVALERVLGAPADCLCLADTETLKEWYVSTIEATHKEMSKDEFNRE